MQVKTIAEQLFFTTVRIDTVAANGAQGAGTGFLFVHKAGGQMFPFVVTNKHVVNGMKAGSLTFLQRDGDAPRLGQGYRLTIEDWPNAWFGHPAADIDIAVCPFAPLEAHIKAQNIDLFVHLTFFPCYSWKGGSGHGTHIERGAAAETGR